mmetsp:Transcript_16223/g.41094  ORF Transcript_16223/g.41094 Transcript_16223/m.41094 type:complete len:96 (-) Transcript_16223:1227-1514(-)
MFPYINCAPIFFFLLLFSDSETVTLFCMCSLTALMVDEKKKVSATSSRVLFRNIMNGSEDLIVKILHHHPPLALWLPPTQARSDPSTSCAPSVYV